MQRLGPGVQKKNILILVTVAALGYFVDIYDLLLFSIVRIQSLQDIGVPVKEMRQMGEYVLNMQMGGLLIGGLIWGVMGDRYGRIKVLFGSILLYSIANICNGFVQDVNSYAFIRFIAGIGLAGELGAGITLVAETMPQKKRGYGTMMVAVIGLFGAVAAKAVSHYFDWRSAYFVGGGLGFLLLFLRMGIFESGMFEAAAKNTKVKKGSLALLFGNRQRITKYIHCILIGLPLWFVVGILLTQSPEIGRALHASGPLDAGSAIMFAYIGISIGDIIAGLLSQWLQSRKKVVLIFCLFTICSCSFYLSSKGISPTQFNYLAFIIGIGVGYWANFVTIAAEQFGTNLRATVTTTVPNFVRGALIPITLVFEWLVRYFHLIQASFIMLFALTAIALYALSRLKESFHKDLDYLEEEELAAPV